MLPILFETVRGRFRVPFLVLQCTLKSMTKRQYCTYHMLIFILCHAATDRYLKHVPYMRHNALCTMLWKLLKTRLMSDMILHYNLPRQNTSIPHVAFFDELHCETYSKIIQYNYSLFQQLSHKKFSSSQKTRGLNK